MEGCGVARIVEGVSKMEEVGSLIPSGAMSGMEHFDPAVTEVSTKFSSSMLPHSKADLGTFAALENWDAG